MTAKHACSPAASPLESMIAPLAPDEFFASYYERDWYKTPQPAAGVGDLLSIDRIDEIISDTELPPTSLTMAKRGEPVPAGDYTFPNGVVDRGSVLDNFRDGATIVLPQLHYADGKLYNFCLALEREFGARVQTNIYLTPGGEQGFGVHYDDHDVFVLQVSGRKTWEIHGKRENLPYRGEGFRRDQDDTGELQATFVLEEGECLYIPRGLAHRAMTLGDEPSLHITVGILVKTWADFMLEAVAEAGLHIPEMRHSLPRSLYFDKDRHAENAATFARLAQAIADKANFEETLGVFRKNFISGQGPRVRGALNALSHGIEPADRFRLREHILYSLDEEDGGIELVVGGSQIPLAADLAPQLAERLQAGHLAMEDFTVADGDDLRDTIGTLVAFGLLIPMEDGTPEKRPGHANVTRPEVLGEDA